MPVLSFKVFKLIFLRKSTVSKGNGEVFDCDAVKALHQLYMISKLISSHWTLCRRYIRCCCDVYDERWTSTTKVPTLRCPSVTASSNCANWPCPSIASLKSWLIGFFTMIVCGSPYFVLQASGRPVTTGYPPSFGHPLALIRSLASFSVTWLSGGV